MFSKKKSSPIFFRLYQDCSNRAVSISGFSEAYNKELRWEVYLHKVWDKTFEEYEEGVNEEVQRIETSHMSETEQENVIADSMSILQSFQPSE